MTVSEVEKVSVLRITFTNMAITSLRLGISGISIHLSKYVHIMHYLLSVWTYSYLDKNAVEPCSYIQMLSTS